MSDGRLPAVGQLAELARQIEQFLVRQRHRLFAVDRNRERALVDRVVPGLSLELGLSRGDGVGPRLSSSLPVDQGRMTSLKILPK